jgi:mono/diheme cytochrome c family protein
MEPPMKPLAALAVTLALAGCAVELQNRQASQALAREAAPPGSVYTGWRVFQDRCASCHGADATGSTTAPDLRVTLREMGPRRFVGLVLRRYDWNLPAGQAGSESAAREALIDQVLQRREGALQMPAWQDEPRVNAHVMDLYAYLAARAEGTQGPGRPAGH